MLVRVYICQNATLLKITCHDSYIFFLFIFFYLFISGFYYFLCPSPPVAYRLLGLGLWSVRRQVLHRPGRVWLFREVEWLHGAELLQTDNDAKLC